MNPWKKNQEWTEIMYKKKKITHQTELYRQRHCDVDDDDDENQTQNIVVKFTVKALKPLRETTTSSNGRVPCINTEDKRRNEKEKEKSKTHQLMTKGSKSLDDEKLNRRKNDPVFNRNAIWI